MFFDVTLFKKQNHNQFMEHKKQLDCKARPENITDPIMATEKL